MFLTKKPFALQAITNNRTDTYTLARARTHTHHTMNQLTWSTLPWHVVVNIFSHLPMSDRTRARLVCHRWNECFHDCSLWRHFTFDFDTELDPHADTLLAMKLHGDHLRSVTIRLNQSQPLSRQRVCQLMDTTLVNAMRGRLNSFTMRFTGENPLCFNDPELVLSVKNFVRNCCGRTTGGNHHLPSSVLHTIDLNDFDVTLDNELVNAMFKNHLLLRKVGLQNRCLMDNINANAMRNLVKQCQHLEEIDAFYHCVDGAVIDMLAKPNRKRPFRRLSLSCNRSNKYFNHFISSESWLNLSLAQPELEVAMNFGWSFPRHLITEVLSVNMPLVDLELNVYAWLTEELQHVCEEFTGSLRSLTFRTNVDWGVQAPPGLEPVLVDLVTQSVSLRELHCHCVLSDDVIERIKSARPSLTASTLYGVEIYAAEQKRAGLECVVRI